MRDTLAERDGWLFIRAEYELSDKPEKIVCWYPIGMRAGIYRNQWENGFTGFDSREHTRIGKPARRLEQYDGVYEVDGLKFQLTEGGKTKAKFQETVAIPCPKVRKRIETRYYRGSWQKYLKNEGWTYA